ncbi:hypothetical protein RJ639_043490 [Escallonia herrerae]|uniref:NAB domain-containing protein n=1 Tax=Escallonia herrerae TaxID=1293975 RepID=A0AA88WFH1_9ASTE|nr:hypothetical protein RJ639_043490 [Escallonia herrerae]
MLQRAASNAYSWWWASHIRTKQSKWLEQSLQDMEEKVQYVLKLIEEDGDSFAKRAEMYYKKRPELIHFVEESYRAFRALAERYDHLSTELQNANTTIASVFPEQVQFAMDDEDEDGSTRVAKNFPQTSGANIPKVPKIPTRDLRGLLTTASKKLQAKKLSKTADSTTVARSGLSKSEALEEIDKLQKDILALQTSKEFVKSSYENSLSKYWEIENQIMEKQQNVSSLQDEFSIGTVIEDDEARTLMAEAALKSCQETLAQLREKQEVSTREARGEHERIEDARKRLMSLKHECLPDQCNEETANGKDGSERQAGATQEGQDLEALREQIKANFEAGSTGSFTVTELAEKIDELVTKVIGLESAVSSQTVLIDRLRSETNDLHSQIRSFEDDKATLIHDSQNLSNSLREVEEKLHGVQDLNQDVKNQNTNLQTHFTEAHCSLDHLSEKMHNVKTDDEPEATERSVVEVESQEESEKPSGAKNSKTLKEEHGKDENVQALGASLGNNQAEETKEADNKSEKSMDPKTEDKLDEQDLSQKAESIGNTEPREAEEEGKDEELNWQQMLLSGLEDKEKILLAEYTTILRNYKEVKKNLSEVEKRNRDRHFETTVHFRELKSAIAKRDQEIQSLRKRLVQAGAGDSMDCKGDQWPTSDLLDDYNIQPGARNPDGYEDQNAPPGLILMDQLQTISVVEEKLRMDIDAILDENLDFWLRFSTAFHQVQKFRTEVEDLQAEVSQLKTKEVKKHEGKSNTSLFTTTDTKSDARALYKHLSEIRTELAVWLEGSALLKDELQRRFSSLCNIQEEITIALKEGVEEDIIKFSSHQAAKFQGEVLNMKQENNKVREELQAGLDHVSALQLEIEKTLAKLEEEFGLSGSKNHNQLRHSTSRSRIPLRSFIFGVKQKKQRQSIFACMHHNRKYPDQEASLAP